MLVQPRVWVIDDFPSVADTVAKLVGTWGYATSSFTDARTALDRLGTTPLAAVITDLEMPVISGVDVARRLLELVPAPKCILLSGGLSDRFEHADLFSAILKKPVDPPALKRTLHALVDPTSWGLPDPTDS